MNIDKIKALLNDSNIRVSEFIENNKGSSACCKSAMLLKQKSQPKEH